MCVRTSCVHRTRATSSDVRRDSDHAEHTHRTYGCCRICCVDALLPCQEQVGTAAAKGRHGCAVGPVEPVRRTSERRSEPDCAHRSRPKPRFRRPQVRRSLSGTQSRSVPAQKGDCSGPRTGRRSCDKRRVSDGLSKLDTCRSAPLKLTVVSAKRPISLGKNFCATNP